MKQQISTFLWYDNQAEEAANFYVSVFKNSRILSALRNGEGGQGPAGSVLTIAFELNGTEFTALNGGPMFKFTEAISLVVKCKDQEEIDYYWDKLTANGGQPSQCGWLKDKYGLSWQIVPENIGELLNVKDPEKSKKVMAELMQMSKLDVGVLKKAGE